MLTWRGGDSLEDSPINDRPCALIFVYKYVVTSAFASLRTLNTMNRLFIWILLLLHSTANSFSPPTENFDAYGVKIAANDILFVQAKGTEGAFLVQFAPFNDTGNTSQCSISYEDSAHYIYSVGLGSKQNSLNSSLFYLFGEVAGIGGSFEDDSGRNGTFVGIVRIEQYEDLASGDPNVLINPYFCYYLQTDFLQFESSYDHQKYSVMGVEPYGQYAFVMATDFVLRYEPYASTGQKLFSRSGNLTWPRNVTFYPCAIDLTETYTIVAGFVRNSIQSRVRATPTIYVMSNNFTILSSWSYTPANNSWQAQLTYSGIGSWDNRYTMSVKINSADSKRVLVGMPFINTVFMFVVENNGATIRLTSSADNGQQTGFGKSVTWMSASQAAILDWSYTLDGKTFLTAEIDIFTTINDTRIPTGLDAVIPNIHQATPLTITTEWIRMVSTPASLAIMDVNGGTMMFLSERPGFYASTNLTDSSAAASMPVISRSRPCFPGTYKDQYGVQPCDLCPSGTRNSDASGAVTCLNCSADSFCPLGAIYENNATVLINRSQAYAYPRTPDMSVFEDILLNNMFTLGSTGHCLVVSPIFWILILLFVIFVLLVLMASMNLCMTRAKREKWRKTIKTFFRQADFVGEGELWLGGLATLAVALMTIMAYHFAISFMNQYPEEDVGPSTFACDPKLRNSKYSSSLQSLAVPITDSETGVVRLVGQAEFHDEHRVSEHGGGLWNIHDRRNRRRHSVETSASQLFEHERCFIGQHSSSRPGQRTGDHVRQRSADRRLSLRSVGSRSRKGRERVTGIEFPQIVCGSVANSVAESLHSLGHDESNQRDRGVVQLGSVRPTRAFGIRRSFSANGTRSSGRENISPRRNRRRER